MRIIENDNSSLYFYRISSNLLPERVIRKLSGLKYYKENDLTITCDPYDLSAMVDSNIFIEHYQDFIYSDVKPAITFLSGGTIKCPKRIPYTFTDYNNSVEITYNALKSMNIIDNRRVCLMHPFAPWAIGSIFQEALLRMNCHVFPIGFGFLPDRYRQQLHDFKPEILIGPASFLSKLIDNENVTLINDCFAVINAGERFAPSLRNKFNKIGIETFNIYGMAEFDTIAFECCYHKLHLLEEFFYFECLTNSNLDNSKSIEGELVITPLYREAFGVFRYRTGDFIKLDISSNCLCGHNGTIVKDIGRMGFICIDGVTLSEIELECAIESTKLPIKEYQLRAIKAKNGYVYINFDFTADIEMNRKQIEKLHYALNHINIDWEDLIRCKSCKIMEPQQVNSLDDRKTVRGKLDKIVWIEDE